MKLNRIAVGVGVVLFLALGMCPPEAGSNDHDWIFRISRIDMDRFVIYTAMIAVGVMGVSYIWPDFRRRRQDDQGRERKP